MQRRTKEDFLEHLQRAWGNNPEYRLAYALLEFVESHGKEMSHVTYGFFTQIAREQQIDDPEVIARVAQYLADTKLLRVEFEFIDDDDKVYKIDVKTVNQARVTGKFVNPGTGEIEPDFEDKLFVFFSASSEAVNLFSRNTK